MRKIIIIVSAVLAMVACEKDNAFKSLPDGKKVFRASTMQTKTVMDGYTVKWENGDAISIYNGLSSSEFSTTLGVPATSADFIVDIEDAPTYLSLTL